jgi:hypothetical protein
MRRAYPVADAIASPDLGFEHCITTAKVGVLIGLDIKGRLSGAQKCQAGMRPYGPKLELLNPQHTQLVSVYPQ